MWINWSYIHCVCKEELEETRLITSFWERFGQAINDCFNFPPPFRYLCLVFNLIMKLVVHKLLHFSDLWVLSAPKNNTMQEELCGLHGSFSKT